MDRFTSSTLQTSLCSLIGIITVSPLLYYAHCEFHRKCEISRRKQKFKQALARLKARPELSSSTVDGKALLGEKDERAELEQAVKSRFASLKIGGRYQNPFEEWREQGAWEWAFWHLVYQPLTGRWPFFFNHGLPTGPDASVQLARTLPQESPDWQHLFGGGEQQPSIRSSQDTADEILGQSWDRVSTSAPSHLGQSTDLGSSGPSSPNARGRPQDGQLEVTTEFSFTWIGQSTCYVQLEGLCILTDPIFSHRTLDSFMAPSRLRPPPCELKDLLRIDVVLVSHSHYDHLDIKAVEYLGNSVLWIIPLGLGSWFKQQGVTHFREMDWWDKTRVAIPGSSGATVEIVACPTMHWSARTPLDTNRSLWNSFAVIGHHTRFFHVGDTGYPSGLFDHIGALYGPFNLAAIPIGSYAPLWHLGSQHTDPVGSVKIMVELRAKMAVGVHWGTWMMSDETYVSPIRDLEKAVRAVLGSKPPVDARFNTVPMGRTLIIKSDE